MTSQDLEALEQIIRTLGDPICLLSFLFKDWDKFGNTVAIDLIKSLEYSGKDPRVIKLSFDNDSRDFILGGILETNKSYIYKFV